MQKNSKTSENPSEKPSALVAVAKVAAGDGEQKIERSNLEAKQESKDPKREAEFKKIQGLDREILRDRVLFFLQKGNADFLDIHLQELKKDQDNYQLSCHQILRASFDVYDDCFHKCISASKDAEGYGSSRRALPLIIQELFTIVFKPFSEIFNSTVLKLMAEIENIDFIPDERRKKDTLLVQLIELREKLPGNMRSYCTHLIELCLQKGATPKNQAGQSLVSFFSHNEIKEIKSSQYSLTEKEISSLAKIAQNLQGYNESKLPSIHKTFNLEVIDLLREKFISSQDKCIKAPKTELELFSLKKAINLTLFTLKIDMLFSNLIAWKLRTLQDDDITSKKNDILYLADTIIGIYIKLNQLLKVERISDKMLKEKEVIVLLKQTKQYISWLIKNVGEDLDNGLHNLIPFYTKGSRIITYSRFIIKEFESEFTKLEDVSFVNKFSTSMSLEKLSEYFPGKIINSKDIGSMPKLEDSQKGLDRLAAHRALKVSKDVELQAFRLKS